MSSTVHAILAIYCKRPIYRVVFGVFEVRPVVGLKGTDPDADLEELIHLLLTAAARITLTPQDAAS